MTTLSRYLGCLPDSTNFFYYHRLVIIQATSSINIHVESLITISVGFAFVLTSSSSFAPRDSLSKLSLSSRLVVSSRHGIAQASLTSSSSVTINFVEYRLHSAQPSKLDSALVCTIFRHNPNKFSFCSRCSIGWSLLIWLNKNVELSTVYNFLV